MSVDVKTYKNNITQLVNAYKWAYPDEYKTVIQQVKENRDKNVSETGDIKSVHNIDSIDRPIHEIPNTLFTIFVKRLSTEETTWFNTTKGARWFAKEFPEFSRVERV